jgi:hypothetical protein
VLDYEYIAEQLEKMVFGFGQRSERTRVLFEEHAIFEGSEIEGGR